MIFLITLFTILLCTLIGLLALGYYPEQQQAEKVSKRTENDTPLPTKTKDFKVLCYNVQFMAGKGYVFWFDVPDSSGPDERPSPEAIQKTTTEIANIIIDEDPDFIFLQEVDHGAKRTDKQDQLKALLDYLPATYDYHSSAFYWKSGFVPHPRILGSAGMKLSIISKHPISHAIRHQLALTPDNILAKHLGIKRAILEVNIPFKEGGELILLNTHLEAFSKQSDTLQKQIDYIRDLLDKLTQQQKPWVIGGDFNLLLPDQYNTLQTKQQIYYQPNSELHSLTDQFFCVPSLSDTKDNPPKWYTFHSNDPDVMAPDRTLDYLFYSPLLSCLFKSVRQHDTTHISDHYPVIASFKLQPTAL